LLFPCLRRIVLKCWWELYWICRVLLIRWTFLLCQSYKSMSMGELSIFWGLLWFLSSVTWSSYCTDLSLAWLESHLDILYCLWLLWGCHFPNFFLSSFILWI
jgi:hypothetical protein